MQKLIAITPTIIDNRAVNTVSARDIHTFLRLKKDFSSWIKVQIKRGRFMENRDFIKVTQKGELSKTGQTKVEYYFTLDAGKHIAMMSGTNKGFEVRDYFLECERIAQNRQIPLKPPSRSKIAADLQANHQIVTFFGLRGDQARLAANTMVMKQYKDFGINPLLESGVELKLETAPEERN